MLTTDLERRTDLDRRPDAGHLPELPQLPGPRIAELGIVHAPYTRNIETTIGARV